MTEIVDQIARALDEARKQRELKEARVREWNYRDYRAYCADDNGRWSRRKKRWFGEWFDHQVGPGASAVEVPAGGVRCAKCGQECSGYELHHLTYERLGNERFEDLVPLCPLCHEMIESWINGTEWRFLPNASDAPEPTADPRREPGKFLVEISPFVELVGTTKLPSRR